MSKCKNLKIVNSVIEYVFTFAATLYFVIKIPSMNDTIPNDEVNLFAYWKVIAKRKKILFFIFFVILTCTAIVNFLSPNIYRGEYVLSMASTGYADLLERINSNKKERLKEILPTTVNLSEEIQLIPITDTVYYRLKVIIEAKNISDIPSIKQELFDYLINFPFYKKSVELRAERLQKESEELNNIILFQQKNDSTESHIKLTDLINRKVFVEQTLKNNLALEIITEEILSYPVKPNIKRNLILASIIGFLAGIFFVYISEMLEKIKTRPQH